jgi:hypothetical protein
MPNSRVMQIYYTRMCYEMMGEFLAHVSMLVSRRNFVTPGFNGKSECIEYMCARIKFTHMHGHSDNQKDSVTKVKY